MPRPRIDLVIQRIKDGSYDAELLPLLDAINVRNSLRIARLEAKVNALPGGKS